MAASAHADLDALRAILDALKPLEAADQQRVLRWAQESLGTATTSPVSTPGSFGQQQVPQLASRPTDIRSFLTQKQPATDAQFAAAVAYYFAFEAPESERRSEITAQDLQNAARLANRTRLKKPIVTLHNTAKSGYLDKQGRGSFRLNTVGENLVAVGLPPREPSGPKPSRRPTPRRPRTRSKANKARTASRRKGRT